jgi:hypothetical protein
MSKQKAISASEIVEASGGVLETKNGAKSTRRVLTPAEREVRRMKNAARFMVQAERRVNNALKRIMYVARLANKQTYNYTPEQAQLVVQALVDAVDDVATKFSGSRTQRPLFTL